mmetsp:Transcript_30149/g.98105  ORF Transcript_30149/g.98105 Transcript_30149/m.98105 type:complete len:303 (-) Transcript_30149:1570-2478(-)
MRGCGGGIEVLEEHEVRERRSPDRSWLRQRLYRILERVVVGGRLDHRCHLRCDPRLDALAGLRAVHDVIGDGERHGEEPHSPGPAARLNRLLSCGGVMHRGVHRLAAARVVKGEALERGDHQRKVRKGYVGAEELVQLVPLRGEEEIVRDGAQERACPAVEVGRDEHEQALLAQAVEEHTQAQERESRHVQERVERNLCAHARGAFEQLRLRRSERINASYEHARQIGRERSRRGQGCRRVAARPVAKTLRVPVLRSIHGPKHPIRTHCEPVVCLEQLHRAFHMRRNALAERVHRLHQLACH